MDKKHIIGIETFDIPVESPTNPLEVRIAELTERVDKQEDKTDIAHGIAVFCLIILVLIFVGELYYYVKDII